MFLQDQRRYKGKDLPIRTSCPEEQLPTRVNWAEKSPATRSRPGHTHGGLQAAVASAKPILWSHARPRVSCPEPAHPWRSPPPRPPPAHFPPSARAPLLSLSSRGTHGLHHPDWHRITDAFVPGGTASVPCLHASLESLSIHFRALPGANQFILRYCRMVF